jgi:hypothetical protein
MSHKFDIQHFLNLINKEKFWKYFEVRACALKDKEKGLFFAYVKLNKINGKNKIFVSDNHKLYIENFKIDEFENFLIRLSENSITLNEEQLSFHLRINFFYDFKERRYSKEHFNINYPCHRLFAEINKFPEFDKIINDPLITNGYYYKNLGSACKEFLGIKFGGGYYPHIQILAPIFIRIEESTSLGEFVRIKISADERISIKDLELILYGERNNGTQTKFNRIINNFTRTTNNKTLEPLEFVTDDESVAIKIILKYGKAIIEDFYIYRNNSINATLKPNINNNPTIIPLNLVIDRKKNEIRKKKYL